MRAIILVAAALAAILVTPAIAEEVQVQGRAAAPGQIVGFATAAEFGTWEMELAPAYTRLAAMRHNAARLLNARQIPVALAIAVQDKADKARTALDQSRRGEAKHPTARQRQLLMEAKRLIAEAEATLEK